MTYNGMEMSKDKILSIGFYKSSFPAQNYIATMQLILSHNTSGHQFDWINLYLSFDHSINHTAKF